MRLSRKTKLIYGVGDTGFSLTSTILGAYFAIFLTDVVGVMPGIAATAIFLGRTWDYVNDPIIGHISDRTRTRWGRRRPFLLFGALPFALAFMLLWWKPPFQEEVFLAIYYAFAYIFFDTAATFVYMPFFALTPELTSDYDERTSLTTYRMFFSILGSLAAFTIPLLIIGAFQPENAGRVFLMGVLFALVSAAPLLLTFFGTREREEFMEQQRPSLKESLRSALKNRAFTYGLGLFLLTWVAIDILQAILLYFIKYVLRREAQSDLFMAVIFVVAMIALPLWNWISKRYSKRVAFIGGIAFWCLVQLVLVMTNAVTPTVFILLLCMLAGVGIAAAHVLPWAILPDAVEWDEWKTGERHEGMYYSLVTLIQKIATSAAVPLVLLLLQITGYQPNLEQQTPAALWGIRIAMGPIPALMLLGAIYFAAKYPLSRDMFFRIQQELERKRSVKAAPQA